MFFRLGVDIFLDLMRGVLISFFEVEREVNGVYFEVEVIWSNSLDNFYEVFDLGF